MNDHFKENHQQPFQSSQNHNNHHAYLLLSQTSINYRSFQHQQAYLQTNRYNLHYIIMF